MKGEATLRLKAYRSFQSRYIEPWLLRRFVSDSQFAEMRWWKKPVIPTPVPVQSGSRRVWFHASSVGELESLWSVIDAWVRGSGEAVVTVFSESARGQLDRLSREISMTGTGKVLFAGFSPWEGNWQRALEAVRPSAFVTAKYEAWPELWAGLALLEIPLVVVGAKARRSFVVASQACKLLGVRCPQISFSIGSEPDREPLQRLFPQARIEVIADPRWDRVRERASNGDARARELTGLFARLSRPWGILGSVWEEDLVGPWFENLKTIQGTMWLVPHRIDSIHLARIEKTLSRAGKSWIRTSSLSVDSPGGEIAKKTVPDCILVDEMGFLSELYSAADWAYVGGGFGAGIHSTIEPAIHGIPIAAGPARAELFPEVQELVETGQLTLVQNGADLNHWLGKVAEFSLAMRKQWLAQSEARMGSTQRVLSLIPGPC